MASVVAQICDNLVGKLGEDSYASSFTAQKSYMPEYRKKDNLGILVTVYPDLVEQEELIRTKKILNITIQIIAQNTIGTGTDGELAASEVEAMMELMEKLLSNLNGYDIPSLFAQQVSATISEFAYPEHLQFEGVYTGVIELTYKVQITNN